MIDLSGAAVLLNYGFHVAPGLLAFALWFVLTSASAAGLRIAILIAGFVLMRDAMTPLGIWAPSATMQIAFIDQPLVLVGLGLASLAMAFGLARLLPEFGSLLVGFARRPAVGSIVGFASGAAVALPVLVLNGFHADRFAQLPWMFGMVILAFGGNALEEVLFRGFLQGHLETLTSPLRAALGSAVAFAACHSFLAYTVTQIGWPVLAFTLVEGVACGLVRMRYGLVPAIITHGTAIFLISVPMAG